MSEKRHANHLIKETSPYLLQHAYNPVEWYPWGKEALALSKKTEKPIFLSIGYSACHWCHVMERESFEDQETADYLKAHFISIKVDREERQDIDHIYMGAVQLMTQRGGWPMSVFLTPDLKPFYGGTYFPPDDRYGMPSFKKILSGVATAWKERRESVLENAEALTEALKNIHNTLPEGKTPELDLVRNSTEALKTNFDPEFGGMGHAPKFFHVMDFRVALRTWKKTQDPQALKMVTETLEAWARGGIRDQLGGGFHRYSTDVRWLAPHFEKMLYDNALVTDLYLEAYQATGNSEYAEVAHHTLDFFLNEMQNAEGGFFSTLDADSEGEEGKFYVWTQEELEKELPADMSAQVAKIYNVTAEGNWEEKNILHRTHSWEELSKILETPIETIKETLAVAHRKLLKARKNRPHPFRDEKILTNWNGLFIDTLARASQILGDKAYYEAAEKAAKFFFHRLYDKASGDLFHTFKDGRSKQVGFLDDYSNMILSLASLYECDFQYDWLSKAEELAQIMLERFYEEKEGKFYFTAKNQSDLIVRPVEAHDGATPSATAMATTALVRLWHLTGKSEYRVVAEKLLHSNQNLMEKIPSGSGQFIIALDLLINAPTHFVIVEGKDTEEFEETLSLIHQKFLPQKTVLKVDPKISNPHFAQRSARDGKTTVYICQAETCLEPITDTKDLAQRINVL